MARPQVTLTGPVAASARPAAANASKRRAVRQAATPSAASVDPLDAFYAHLYPEEAHRG